MFTGVRSGKTWKNDSFCAATVQSVYSLFLKTTQIIKWLVVSTPLKNISGIIIPNTSIWNKNVPNHQPDKS